MLPPPSVTDLAAFAGRYQLDEEEARRSFYFCVALRCISADEFLGRHLVVRGSGAMWLTYGLPRIPRDLDLVATHYDARYSPPNVRTRIEKLVSQAITRGIASHYPTEKWVGDMSTVMHIQISPFYANVNSVNVRLRGFGEASACVRACDISYLLAEKLIALVTLPDPIQKRYRDFFDIAWMLRSHHDLVDRRRVQSIIRAALVVQGHALQPLAKVFSEECGDAVRERYRQLAAQAIAHDLPFETVWPTVVSFVTENVTELR